MGDNTQRYYEFVGKRAWWPPRSMRPALPSGSASHPSSSPSAYPHITIILPDTPQARARPLHEYVRLLPQVMQAMRAQGQELPMLPPPSQPSSEPSPQPTPSTAQPTQPELSQPIQSTPSLPPQGQLAVRPERIPRITIVFQQNALPSPTQAQPAASQPQRMYVVFSYGDDDGTNAESFMNQLFQSQQPQTIPAAQHVIDSLPQIQLTQDVLAKQFQCPVCMEDFRAEETAAQLPCKHCFHTECVRRWLHTQHTCPICRHELPVAESTNQIPTLPSVPLLPAPQPVLALPAPEPVLSLPAPEPALQPSTPLPPQPSVPLPPQPSAPPSQPLQTVPLPSTTTNTANTNLLNPTTTNLPNPTTTNLPSPTTTNLPNPTTTNLPTPITPNLPNSTSTTPSERATPHESGVKRGFLLPNSEPASKKKKVEETKKKEDTGLKKGFLLEKGSASKKEKAEKKEDGNGFGFKRGFLLNSSQQK